MDGWGFVYEAGMPNFSGHSLAGAVSAASPTRRGRNVTARVAKFAFAGAA